jgi:hypothetical protein
MLLVDTMKLSTTMIRYSKIEPNDVFVLNHKGMVLFSLDAEANTLFDKALGV